VSNGTNADYAGCSRDTDILVRARRELLRVADARKAPRMQAYMKSTMPYHGVQTPCLRQTFPKIFTDTDFASRAVWRERVLRLWRGAEYREERYAAIALSGHELAGVFQSFREMPLYEEMIVTGAWWDYVDHVAVRRVGPILRKYPTAMKKKILAWSRSHDLWKRRTSILCQLGFKGDTDLDLLYACIEPSLDSKEFFLRKAIGWALRQHARTDAAEVKEYVRRHEVRLSALSKREALKNCRR
jgi:3-methyladenine DNA glycosylase AlkD